MNGIDDSAVYGLLEFFKGTVAQKPDHFMVGEIERETVFTVAADHSSRRHLGEDGGSSPAVFFRKFHKGRIFFRDMDNSRQSPLGCIQPLFSLFLLSHVTDGTIVEFIPSLFLQKVHMHMNPDGAPVIFKTPDVRFGSV